MVFKCQEDSFLKEYSSKVISCTESTFEVLIEGQKKKKQGYEVILEDTILFPEGGGQPSDRGYLNEKQVYQVLRRGDKAVHYVDGPFKEGETVKQVVDWLRRSDHMQQHSGQHLISGIIERDFKIAKLSWWLGEEVSYIELESPIFTEEQIKKVEETVNELIRSGKKVTVKNYSKDTPMEDLNDFRSAKDLPEDHVGDIRVVTIEDVESNMCCGTHVSNLSQLQVIKLLHVEKSKRKNNCLLHFLVGGRVLSRLKLMLEREKKLMVLLNTGPEMHVEIVDKLVKNSKLANKNLQTVLKDLAILEAQKFKKIDPKPKFYCLHRKEAEPDFMGVFIKEVNSTDTLLFLSTGDEKGCGNIMLYGNEKDVAELGNRISEILNGKGAGKGNRYNAKVTEMKNRNKVEELLKNYFG